MSYTQPNEVSVKYKVVFASIWELEETLNKFNDTEWILHSVVFVSNGFNVIFYDETYF